MNTMTDVLREGGRLRRQRALTDPQGARRSRLQRGVSWLLMLLLTAGGVFGVVGSAAADDNAESASFYKLSSQVTAMFSNAVAPREEPIQMTEAWVKLLSSPANGGSVLGYTDPDFSLSLDWLASQLSGSSDAIAYRTLAPSADGGEDSPLSGADGPLRYAQYGALLNSTGLDSTSTSMGFSLNSVTGSLMMLNFLFAGITDLVFGFAIDTLEALNPFRVFYEGVLNAGGLGLDGLPKAGNQDFADGMVGDAGAADGIFSGVTQFIGGIYVAISNLAWNAIIPLMIALTIASVMLWQKTTVMQGLRKLFIRGFFLVLGLPLLGMAYTGTLNAFDDMAVGSQSIGAVTAVNGTYVDFEAWMNTTRLRPPDGGMLAWDQRRNAPADITAINLRKIAVAINQQSGVLPADNVINLTTGSFGESIVNNGPNKEVSNAKGYSNTLRMLARYISGEQVSSAAFETAAKGKISQRVDSEGGLTNEQVGYWFKQYIEPRSLDALATKEDADWDGEITPNLNPVLAVEAGGGLAVNVGADNDSRTVIFRSTSPKDLTSCVAQVSTKSGAPMNCNLSPLAAYNYLNTSFGTDSMVVYSSQKAMSGATRETHNSVSSVGTGLMGFMYWTNTMTLLLAFNVIGLGYAFALLLGAFRRFFEIVSTVPFAMLGSMQAIAKVVVNTLALILTVMLTVFIYQLVQMLLVGLPALIEVPFAAALNNTGAETAATIFLTGRLDLVVMITVTLSIIMTITFTVLAMRMRKSIISAVTEMATKVINKFMGVEGSPDAPPRPGAMGALAGGAAMGAGMGLASKAMGGSGAGGAKAPGANQGGTGTPNGAAAAPKPKGPGSDGKYPAPSSRPGRSGTGVPGQGTQGQGSDSSSQVGGGVDIGDGTMTVDEQGNLRNADGTPVLDAQGNPVAAPVDDSASAPSAGVPTSQDEIDRELAAGVEQNGLSTLPGDEPADGQGGSAGPQAPEAPGGGVSPDLTTAAPPTDGEKMLEGGADRLQQDAEAYKEADQKQVAAVGKAAEGAGNAALAAGQAYSGDAQGAMDSANRAANSLQDAKASSDAAKDLRNQTGTAGDNASATVENSPTPSAPSTSGGPGGAPATPTSNAPKSDGAPRLSPNKPVGPSGPGAPTGGAAPVAAVLPIVTGGKGATPSTPSGPSASPQQGQAPRANTPVTTQNPPRSGNGGGGGPATKRAPAQVKVSTPNQAPTQAPVFAQGSPIPTQAVPKAAAPVRSPQVRAGVKKVAANPVAQQAALIAASNLLNQQAQNKRNKKKR